LLAKMVCMILEIASVESVVVSATHAVAQLIIAPGVTKVARSLRSSMANVSVSVLMEPLTSWVFVKDVTHPVLLVMVSNSSARHVTALTVSSTISASIATKCVLMVPCSTPRNNSVRGVGLDVNSVVTATLKCVRFVKVIILPSVMSVWQHALSAL